MFLGNFSIIEYGRNNAIVRSEALGYCKLGLSYYALGDFDRAIEVLLKGIDVSRDTFYTTYLSLYLGAAYVQTEDYTEAIKILKKVSDKGKTDSGQMVCLPSAFAEIFYGAALIAEGKMQKGLKKIYSIKRNYCSESHTLLSVMADCVLGSIFSKIVQGENILSVKKIIKNIGFIIQNVPGAMKKTEKYLFRTIEAGTRIGSDFLVSQASYDLGCAYSAKNKNEKALIFLSSAKSAYQQMGAEIHLKNVQKHLDRLN